VLREWLDVVAVARVHLPLDEAMALVDDEEQLAALDVDRLVLLVVVLQAELVALLHV
jgi:hypothetical protein